MLRDLRLETYLAERAVACEVIDTPRHLALVTSWEAVYGKVWALGLRHRHGRRAQDEYSRRPAEAFLIVPFTGNRAGPHAIGTRERTVAYECHGGGGLPDLSSFANLDFFIAPLDLRWTMLHTHEDYGLGGPYFIDRDWLVPPTRGRGSGHP